MERTHAYIFIVFATLLGLFEGPAEIACVVAILSIVLTQRFRGFRFSFVEVGLIVWVSAGVFGLVSADSRPSSEDMLRPLLALAFLVGLFGFRRISVSHSKKVAFAFTIAILVNASYGFLQFFIGELPLDSLLLANPKSPQVHIPNHYGLRTVSGLYYNRLKLAHMAIPALGLLLIPTVALRRKLSLGRTTLYILASLILFVAVVITQARMALAALILSFIFTALVLARLRYILFLFAGTLIAAGLTFGMRFGVERIQAIGTDFSIRAKIFGIGFSLFEDNPIFGIGHGMYRIRSTAIRDDSWAPSYLVDAHQLYLHVLTETGIVGFVGFFGMVALSLVFLVREVRRTRREESVDSVALRVLLFVLVAYLALGLFHFPLHHAPVALMFWFVLGLASSIRHHRRENPGLSFFDESNGEERVT